LAGRPGLSRGRGDAADLRGAGDAFATEEAIESAVAVEDTDATCASAEWILQKVVEGKCGVSGVSCAYKMEGNCDDWCSPSAQCGYIQDNDFVKFHNYQCTLGVDTSKGFDASTVMCKPEFTPLGVGSLVAVVLLALGCCCCCIWCCCCRSRR